jgi:hypothetical protein
MSPLVSYKMETKRRRIFECILLLYGKTLFGVKFAVIIVCWIYFKIHELNNVKENTGPKITTILCSHASKISMI